MEISEIEDAIYASTMPTAVQVRLLQMLKEYREVAVAREKAVTLNRIMACVIHGMKMEHGEGVVLPLKAEALQEVNRLLEVQKPIINLHSLADGGAEVSLGWEPR